MFVSRTTSRWRERENNVGRERRAKKREGGMENEDRTEKKGRVTRVKVIDEEVRRAESDE